MRAFTRPFRTRGWMDAGLLAVLLTGLSGPAASRTPSPSSARAAGSIGEAPFDTPSPYDSALAFEPNRGQTDPRVEFLCHGPGYTLFLTPGEAVLTLSDSGSENRATQERLRMRLAGANPHPRIVGLDPLAGKSHYLRGSDSSRWHTDIPTYARVEYQGVYPGVDLVFYGNQGRLEYDFIVAPGVAPEVIRLGFEGAELAIDASGDLLLRTGVGRLRLQKPFIYQLRQGIREEVPGRFVLENEREVGFRIAAHDESRPLVIDPILIYSTYLGGTSDDVGYDVAVDEDGNAHVTGTTLSVDFPTTPDALQSAVSPTPDVYVAKFDAAGAMIYSTYLGGDAADVASAIAVDAEGSSYVTGYTVSADFPVMNAFQPSLKKPPYRDAFVLKLNRDGSALVYSSYLGGTDPDMGLAIAVDSSGNAFVAGGTESSDFPTANPLQASYAGGESDAFVAKIDPAGSSLLYSTYLGSSGIDVAHDLDADSAGQVYVTGVAGTGDFPVFQALQPAPASPNDAFVAKLDGSGASFVYSTFLGGSRGAVTWGVAADLEGSTYVVGSTTSPDFPTTPGAFQIALSASGSSDAFVTKLDPAGSSLVYSTYLGGADSDQAMAVAVDSSARAHVVGITSSPDFPTSQPVQASWGGADDGFVASFDASGSSLAYASHLGGSQPDAAHAVALDASGNAYVTGSTLSEDFPTANAAQGSHAGGTVAGTPARDVFVAKIAATTRTTFGEAPFSIPGAFEAEDFDLGGEGVAYHDAAVGNAGGFYRPGEDVDLVPASGNASGHVVNNIETGEWLEYTIDVATSGSYTIELHVSSQFTSSRFHVEIDGVDVTGSIPAPDTGWWGTFAWAGAGGVTLSSGRHVLRVHSDEQYFNLDAVRVSQEVDETPSVEIASPADGSTVSGTVTVTTRSSGDVVAVTLWETGLPLWTKIGEDTTAPFSFEWDTTTYANGTYSFVAEARDGSGAVKSSTSSSWTVVNDTITARVEDTDPRILYIGEWVEGDTSRSWSGGSAATSRAGRARLFFEGGSRFAWIGYRGPDGGMARVWLGDAHAPNETLLGVVDTYAPVEQTQAVLFSYAGALPSGGWALDIEPTGEKNPSANDHLVVVDAFDVRVGSDDSGDSVPPSVSITAPADGADVSGTIQVTADASDDVEVAGVQFYLGSSAGGPGGPHPLGAEDTSAPYSIEWDTTQSIGPHELTAVARDTSGNTGSATIRVNVSDGGTEPQSPFTGAPFVAPGAFEAEDFDLGGENVAYHDAGAGNVGGAYRTGEDVDIIAASGNATGFVVNGVQTGEWLEYTIEVATTGIYRIDLHVSTEFTTSRFHVEIDGVDVTGSVSVPDTGWWRSFEWVGAGSVTLAAGRRVLRVQADEEYFNLDAIRVQDGRRRSTRLRR